MVKQQENKRKTDWRKQLARHGIKVLLNPLKYCRYKATEYSEGYEKKLKYRLRKKHRILFPHEYSN